MFRCRVVVFLLWSLLVVVFECFAIAPAIRCRAHRRTDVCLSSFSFTIILQPQSDAAAVGVLRDGSTTTETAMDTAGII